MSDLVFLDTETTGLTLDDDIWEFAAVRREPNGTERELHLFLEHSPFKCARLPESFRLDHEQRFPPMDHNGKWNAAVVSQSAAAKLIDEFLQGRPHVIGAVPGFDLDRIEVLMRDRYEDWTPPWHYHVIDVENVALGYLNGRGTKVLPPYKSDDLAALCGVEPAGDERHTAMGDVRWVMRWYDAMTGGAS